MIHSAKLQKLPENIRIDRDLVYARTDKHQLRLDLYWHPEATRPMPLIIWVHGGAWRNGTKNVPSWVTSFCQGGYAVASVEYRLSHQAIFPAQIEDCKSAVRWLRANAEYYRIDPDRFGAWGSSAGGHLVALLGTSGLIDLWEVGDHLHQTSCVQAVCDWFGPTDFLRMNDVAGEIDHDAPDSPESQLIGGLIQENKGKVAKANPITYVSLAAPPFLIIHGKLDMTVIKNQSELLHQALQKKGNPSKLILIDDMAHGFWGVGVNLRQDILHHVWSFFDQHLKKCT